MPLAMGSYKPSTTTILMLEDPERMSSSAVYSGDSSQAWTCRRLSNSSMGEAPRHPITQYELNLTATRHELAAVSLNSTRHPLKKLSIETRICYLNIGYYVCRHTYVLISSLMLAWWRRHLITPCWVGEALGRSAGVAGIGKRRFNERPLPVLSLRWRLWRSPGPGRLPPQMGAGDDPRHELTRRQVVSALGD